MLNLFRLNLNKKRKKERGGGRPEEAGSFGEPTKGGFHTIQRDDLIIYPNFIEWHKEFKKHLPKDFTIKFE